ncbi:Dad3p [Sporobolomyces salmoneus]|uniref:Dad3p n=1 Tax=Sporobolomyces salmoneus TaxID=183962 RepID=UPI0031784DB6
MSSSQVLITKLEQQVLDEYALISRNLDEMSAVVQRLSAVQPHLLAELRPLERKIGLVFTLLKASVWSILRQREDQQMYEEEARQ